MHCGRIVHFLQVQIFYFDTANDHFSILKYLNSWKDMQSIRFDDYEGETDDDPFSTKVMSFEVGTQ